MNKTVAVNSLMLAPLIGATDSLMTALGLWLMFVGIISAYGLGMRAIRPRLAASSNVQGGCVVLAATLTSCAELAAQAWSLPWQQHLGVYCALIALQCVVLEHTGFFQHSCRARLRLYGLFGALMMGLGMLRELIGTATLGAHLSWLVGVTQSDGHGWVWAADGGLRIATLAPGGFILLGLLIAAWQAWSRSALSNFAFEETHRP
ncbi:MULTISPECIES: Rnf-Nqr domain containing protein [unclassified Pseudomonas]|uniref:Rnf-Nqr domain containing protein n=1 Tax=unclassified Pseudomonas TaxID=196821 RepID=UPI002AC8DA44|nr:MULTISPECIES: Rnf-Nqr domain containing protein [unclassified Pseudomonas]MEB0045049.1 Rnf-Nqr domain containing protein [Pseudomonas sp. Dout3]MEB0095939.1 Rnf-Nqr domain containing protein [Pseudomonas sp. DC1.2]WPX57806.1 Rnf-Nqr domain containing protein [Pseudomonas sp. DC1.2]